MCFAHSFSCSYFGPFMVSIDPSLWFGLFFFQVMARRVYRSRSRSADRAAAEAQWHNERYEAAGDRSAAGGGLRGWDDDSDDGKFQLKACSLMSSHSDYV